MRLSTSLRTHPSPQTCGGRADRGRRGGRAADPDSPAGHKDIVLFLPPLHPPPLRLLLRLFGAGRRYPRLVRVGAGACGGRRSYCPAHRGTASGASSIFAEMGSCYSIEWFFRRG